MVEIYTYYIGNVELCGGFRDYEHFKRFKSVEAFNRRIVTNERLIKTLDVDYDVWYKQ